MKLLAPMHQCEQRAVGLPARIAWCVLWGGICTGSIASAPCVGATVVLVTQNNGSLTADETSRKSQFETWGYSVTTVWDGAAQATYDAAVDAAQAVYVPMTVSPTAVGYKLRTKMVGVVVEEVGLDVEMGFATLDSTTSSVTQITLVDAAYGSGAVIVFSSSMPAARMQGTVAAGFQTIANLASGSKTMGKIVKGGALANTYSGNSTASGRRIRVAWGGDSFAWSALHANGLSIIQQALAWASSGDKLILHAQLDETSGTSVADASGNGHNGTISGSPVWSTEGRRRGSLDLETTDGADRVDLGNFDLTGSGVSLAAWIQQEDPLNDGRIVIKSSDNTSANQSWGLTCDETGEIDFRIHAGGTWYRLQQPSATTPGEWQHVVGTYDGTTLRLYLDGVLVQSHAHPVGGAVATSGSQTVTIGDSPIGGRPFDGKIDDVRVYDYALTASQVAEVHGLIAHWKLDEASGTTAADSTLAANHASLSGTQGWTSGMDAGAHDFVYSNGNDYFTAPANTALNEVQGGDYTVMAYFKPHSTPPGTGSDNDADYGIVRKTNWQIGIAYNYNNEFLMEHWLDGVTWTGAGTWGTAYVPGTFHHVAGVVDQMAGEVRLYVDGVLINTGTFTPGAAALDKGSEPWRIGVSDPSASQYAHPADGVVDDVRIYNRALSSEELASYQSGGLAAHWKLDEGSGVTVSDDSDNGNDGAFDAGSPVWTSGPRDGALYFDGTSGVVTDAPFDPPPIGSVAFWFRPDSLPATTQKLFGSSGAWEVRYSTDGRLYFDLGVFSGAGSVAQFTEGGRWRHVVANYNTTNGAYSIYVDGQFDSSGTLALSDQGAADFYLGTRTGSSEFFSGALDDVRIYRHELTPDEIGELYGMIGHWTFDEGSGTTIADSSSTGADASFHIGSPVWIDGVRGGALEFDGASSAITTQTVSPPLKGTVAFWFRSDGPPAARQRLWGLGGDFEMWQDPDGRLSCDVLTDGFQGGFITDTALYDAGRWYHIAAVFDSDDDSYAIYVNGKLEKSGISTWAMAPQAAAQLSFGTRTGSSEYLSGALDDFRLYGRMLSVAEIAELYGLVGHWRFEETSGSVAYDSSGAGNHGTVVGTPGWTAAGKEGGAMEFDGSTYVDIATQFDQPTSVTLAGWAKLTHYDDGGAGTGTIVSIGEQFGLRLAPPSAGAAWGGAVGYAYDGSSYTTANDLVGYAGSAWRHFAAVFDDDSGEIALYVDGVLVASTSVASPIAYAYNLPTRIGANAGADTTHDFSGFLDEVRVYNRALNVLEIRELFYGSYVSGVRIIRWVETR